MLSVEDALAEVIRHATPIDVETVPLAAALGRALAEDVTSGLDSPPFDKSLMDGFAVRGSDTANAGTMLSVIEAVTAGQVPSLEVGAGQATRIMTGAPLPAGADTVVPIERTTPGEDRVRIDVAFAAGKNILYQGESMQTGERVLAAGHGLRPQDLGVLAELGIASVPVRRRPRVAILATGDELVPPDREPGPGQIRNSNESLLVGLVAAAGCEPVPLGIARDKKDELRTKIDAGLMCDLLILSGGVSAGDLDLVPQVLQEAGVRQVFHKVNVKPGKPVYMGSGMWDVGCGALRPNPTSHIPHPLIFGLPGNPVSALVCFELFAKTAVRRMLGIEPPGPRPVTALLTQPFENRGDRPTYHPAKITVDSDGRLTVTTVRWAGSGDLRATVDADGVAVFEPNRSYTAGETIDVLPWPGGEIGFE
ncbi:MAG: gephyrin-like molybdotransferase Glp [Planctomycetaceae bacterium]